jgi:endonuclease YncB( thermonuclease family)
MFGSCRRLAWVGLWLTAAVAAAPATPQRMVQGTVSRVVGGDSVWLTPAAGTAIEVRLRDIDAPEPCQPWGPQARQALEELVLGKAVAFRPSGRDERGRAVGVLMRDEVNVGTRQVEDGHAWSVRTRWDEGPLVKQERMARALSRGLHGAPDAQMPRHFRVTHGPCGAGEVAVNRPASPAPVAAAPAAPSLPATRPAPAVTTPPPPAAASRFRCDGRTHCSQMTSCAEAKYFQAQCPGVKMDGDGNGIPCERQWCR